MKLPILALLLCLLSGCASRETKISGMTRPNLFSSGGDIKNLTVDGDGVYVHVESISQSSVIQARGKAFENIIKKGGEAAGTGARAFAKP